MRAEIGFIGVLISYGNTEPKVTGVMLCVAERSRVEIGEA